MAQYRYIAIDQNGRETRGLMEATCEAQVIETLHRQGLLPIRADIAGKRNFITELLSTDLTGKGGLTKQDVADVTRELATMLGAGQDLDRALRFIVETAPNKRIARVMQEVRDKVRGGTALATALSQHPQSFPRLYIGLIRAGEAGGTLGETLERLAILLERQRALAATIQSALVYPVILLIAAISSIVVLLTVVLPQFVPLFEQNGAELPGLTKFMINLGDLTATAGPWVLLLILIGILAARQSLKDPAVRLPVDRFILTLPIAGALTKQTIAARFNRTLGTLLKNGVPLISALAIVKDAMGNLAAVAAVERATASAKGGNGLAKALGDSAVFPARTIHLLRLGEETAQLANMSLRAAEIHEEEARLGVQGLIALMVPVITVIMGAAVALIVGSLLLAMTSLNDLAA